MLTLRCAAVALVLAFSTSADGRLPAWSGRTYPAPADQVYAAALKVLAAQHHKPRDTDELNKTIGFHLGMRPPLGGYNLVLKVSSSDQNTSNVSIDLAPQQTPVANGTVEREVIKILDGIQTELARATPATSK